jgi:hypothetical protein
VVAAFLHARSGNVGSVYLGDVFFLDFYFGSRVCNWVFSGSTNIPFT